MGCVSSYGFAGELWEGCFICVSYFSFTGLSSNRFMCAALTGRESTGDAGSLPCTLSCNAFAISLCASTAERAFEIVAVLSAASAL